VFCEVKSKFGLRHGEAIEMVDDEKQLRVRRAAEAWLARRPELGDLEVRFDVVAVDGARLDHVADAF
jgi:putative endonuclease